MPTDPLADQALVARALRGDPRGMVDFYDRVQPVIRRTVGRLLGFHDADLEDLMQNAAIELIKSLPSFRAEGSLDGWTSVVTARVVYQTLRGRKLERQRQVGVPLDEGSAPSPLDLERASAAKQMLGRIRVHLDAMEEAKAWTYVLHDVCGYRLQEIASITQVSVAAAQSRLVRGRAELERRLGEDPELADELRKAAP